MFWHFWGLVAEFGSLFSKLSEFFLCSAFYCSPRFEIVNVNCKLPIPVPASFNQSNLSFKCPSYRTGWLWAFEHPIFWALISFFWSDYGWFVIPSKSYFKVPLIKSACKERCWDLLSYLHVWKLGQTVENTVKNLAMVCVQTEWMASGCSNRVISFSFDH
jgi:hypothetical protein